jgi:shikimate kinase
MPNKYQVFAQMRVFLTGVSCVGKTTIGTKLADLLDYAFIDLDAEIERYFRTSIERLQRQYLTAYSFRKEASKALKHVLSRKDGRDCVIVLPPSGLMDSYWRVVKRAEGTIVVVRDEPENIVKRAIFYDIDSRPIHKDLTEKERRLYVREIRKDIAYFGRTYRRAHITVDIAGLAPDDAARKLKEVIGPRQHAVTEGNRIAREKCWAREGDR